MIANETIEAHLTFLRTSVDEVKADMRGLQTDNRTLRDKIDAVRSELIHRVEQVRIELVDKIDQLGIRLDNKIDRVSSLLDNKIDQLSARLDNKIDQLSARLGEKIDQLGTRLDGVSADQKAGDEKLGAKIDQLSEKLSETNVSVAKVAALQKAMFWAIGGIVSLAALLEMVIRAGEKFHWF